MTTLLQLTTEIPLNTWLSAPWEAFIQQADAPESDRLKGYYYQGRMRFEPMSTGSDHSKDHTTLILSVGLFATLQGIPINGHDNCSYRRTGVSEFQPDASYYIGENADVIPWGTRVIDLESYPLPSLAIEISDTSLGDDLGAKRLQYEELGIEEYWIVNVQEQEIIAFAIAPDRSSRRIRESQVLPGLRLEILEQALARSRQENQSATTAWLMEQFQA
ncbi:Uma2 family endonuclease [Roseofilum sp. BLCC_M91]|uniref:Uma2 family endonuclease n=1 Tax=Roseofilum halophilum BLCC-M91 TaxID=3022259 RepID=A0ABT7BGN4_9CYAN|nr:Uma2 family endonuclease [Roseofilum halophilum]MDJ1177937.1 Uma2 family endonuclease [Roseofilum halophilum BLCC-M91]